MASFFCFKQGIYQMFGVLGEVMILREYKF